MYDRFSRWVFEHRLVFLLLVCLVCVSLDQATKIWAQGNLAEPRTRVVRVSEGGELKDVERTLFVHTRTVEVIDGGFNLIYRENPAAAFSLTRSLPDWLRRPFLLIFSSLAMILIGAWYFRLKREDGLLMGAFAFIVAGAIGNLIDRARFGYVVDFLDVYISWGPVAQWLTATVGTNHWPTFNVADSCIVVGALAVVYRTLKPLPEEAAEGDKAAAAGASDPVGA
jgi:signal peptidase II